MAQYLYNSTFEINKTPRNLENFFDFLVKEGSKSAILILPTGKYVDKIKRDFLKYNFRIKNTPTSELLFFTLQEFAKICFDKIYSSCENPSAQIINDSIVLYFIEEAVYELEDLEYYNSQNISLETIKKIASVISGLKEDGITVEKMKKELIIEQSTANASKRFNDLYKIYSTYEKKIRGKYLDSTDIYYEISKKIYEYTAGISKYSSNVASIVATNEENFLLDKYFQDIKSILFYGFTDFKLPEVEFISKFSLSKIPIVINISYSQLEGPNIKLLSNNIKILTSNWLNQFSGDLSSYTLNNTSNKTYSQHIKQFLFNETVQSFENHKTNIPQIEIFEAENRIEEVKNIANLVYYLHKEENVQLENICICSRNPKIYAKLFREFFSESGLPINVSDRFELSSSAPVTAIINLLEFSVSKFSHIDLLKLSNINYLKQKIKNIEKLSLIASKYKFYSSDKKCKFEKWNELIKKIETYQQRLEEQLTKKENRDNEDNYYIETEVQELKESKEILLKLKEYFNFSNTLTYSEFRDIIRINIIEKLEILETIFSQYKVFVGNREKYNEGLESYQLTEEIEKNASALVKFIEVLEEFVAIGQKENSDKKYGLDELTEKFKTVLSIEKYQIREKHGIGVNITSIEQTRGIPYEIIILCGAIENEFPLRFQIDTFLGKDLPESEERHYDTEKILFYQLLTNNTELFNKEKQKIFIFFPNKDNDKKTNFSQFINDLISISTNLCIKKISELKTEENLDEKHKWIFYKSQYSDLLKNIYNHGETLSLRHKNIKSKFDTLNFCISNDIKNNNKIYSITELETYAKCPFQYFVRYVAKIKTKEDYSETLSGLEIGSFVHEILEKFYRKNLKNSTKKINSYLTFDLTDEDKKEEYKKDLKSIFESGTKEYDTPIYKYEIMRIKDDDGMLSMWVENEIEKNKRWRYSSILFEEKIGDRINGIKLILQNEPEEKYINIFGKVDRVELSNDETKFIIADYKTTNNSIPNIKKIEDGSSLQLPIYLLALQKKYQSEGFTPDGGVYYSLEKKIWDNDFFYKYLEKLKEEETLQKSLRYAINYKEEIERKVFTAKNGNACRWCSAKTICRVNK